MGASGAGKTTLLNCLTLRNTGKLTVSGQRRINGLAVDSDLMGQLSGYVQQEDLFVGSLTVKEHLRFQVSFRICKYGNNSHPFLFLSELFHLSKCVIFNKFLRFQNVKLLTLEGISSN